MKFDEVVPAPQGPEVGQVECPCKTFFLNKKFLSDFGAFWSKKKSLEIQNGVNWLWFRKKLLLGYVQKSRFSLLKNAIFGAKLQNFAPAKFFETISVRCRKGSSFQWYICYGGAKGLPEPLFPLKGVDVTINYIFSIKVNFLVVLYILNTKKQYFRDNLNNFQHFLVIG